MIDDPRVLLRRMFDAAVARAMPDKCVPPFLPKPPKGRTLVVGAGKAAATMAKAVEDHWPGELTGLVVTRYGHHARLPTHRSRGSRASGAGRGRTRGRRAHPEDGPGAVSATIWCCA